MHQGNISNATDGDRMSNSSHFATKAIHIGNEPDQWRCHAVVPPIFLSTTFEEQEPAVTYVMYNLQSCVNNATYEYSRYRPRYMVYTLCVHAIAFRGIFPLKLLLPITAILH